MRMFPRSGGLHPPMDANALHLWTFDEASAGADAKDLQETSAVPLVHTASPSLAAGPVNYLSRGLNGSTQWFTSAVYAADMAALTTVTVVGCIKLSNTISGLRELFCYGSNGGNLSFNIYLDGNRLMYFQWTNGVSFVLDQVVTSLAFPKGRWVPFAWTRDSAAGTIKFHVEGGLAQTFTGQSTVATVNAAARYFLGVGRAGANPTPCNLATLAVYNHVKTDAQIEDIFARMRLLGMDSSLYMKTEVQDGAGNWQDLTALRRVDFIRSVAIKDDVDQKMASASIVAMRQHGNMALARYHDNVLNRLPLAAAPLATTYSDGAELLRLNAPVRVMVDRRALGTGFAQDAGSANWNSIHEGSVDSTDGSGSNELAVETRDIGGRMMDVFVPVTTTRASAGGTALETVITDAITAAKGTAPPTNYANNWGLPNTGYYAGTFWDVNTPTSPGWNVRSFLLQPSALLDTINKWTEQIGWFFRAMFDQATEAWRMTLATPPRNQTYPNLVLDERSVMDVSELKVAIEDIRNEIWVTMTPHSSVAQPMTVPTIPSGTGNVAAGAFYYGAAGSYAPALTASGQEANRVVFRVKSSDLHASESGQDSITKYGVRRMMVAEGATSQIDEPDEVQAFAVAMLRDLQEPKVAMGIKVPCMPELEVGDTIRIRQNTRWFTSDQTLAVVNSNHTLDAREQTTQLGLRGRASGGSSIHLDKETRAGVAPVATEDATQQTHLLAGTTTRDRRRVQSILMAMNPRYLRGSPPAEIRNSEFSARSFGESPPDGWTSTTWGTYFTLDTTVSETGQASVKNSNTLGDLTSDFLTVRQGGAILVDMRIRSSVVGATVRADFLWFKRDFTAASVPSTSSNTTTFTAANVWVSELYFGLPAGLIPVDAAYCKISLIRAGAVGNVWFQRVETHQLTDSFHAYCSTSPALTSGVLTRVPYNNSNGTNITTNGTFDFGAVIGSTPTFLAAHPGWYSFAAQVRVGGKNNMDGFAQILKNGATVLGECASVAMSGSNNTLCLQVRTSVMCWLNRGDTVEVWVEVAGSGGAGTLAFVGGVRDTWFSGRNFLSKSV